MTSRISLLLGGLLAALAVGLGAFGAHAMQAVLDERELALWNTAVQYQMWHALGLLALGACRLPRLGVAVALLATGTVIFAGTLYLLALTGVRWLGMITPVGGTLMIVGWLFVAWRACAGRWPGARRADRAGS